MYLRYVCVCMHIIIVYACTYVYVLCSLRSPKAPDGECDMGTHTFSYAVMPHNGMYTLLNAQGLYQSPLWAFYCYNE